MKLNEVLRAVEAGTSGKEHAEWLRVYVLEHGWSLDNILSIRSSYAEVLRATLTARDKARADAVKVAQECRNLAQQLVQAVSLVSLYEIARDSHDLAMRHCDEARGWAICMMRERNELQAELDILKDALDAKSKWQQLHAELDVKVECHRLGMQVDALQAELDAMAKDRDGWENTSDSLAVQYDDAHQHVHDLQDTLVRQRNELREELRGECEHGERLTKKQDRLQEELEDGTKELRRYVEGNGFTWCEYETTVFNVTTALGLLGGEIKALVGQRKELQAELDALKDLGEKDALAYQENRDILVKQRNEAMWKLAVKP